MPVLILTSDFVLKLNIYALKNTQLKELDLWVINNINAFKTRSLTPINIILFVNLKL